MFDRSNRKPIRRSLVWFQWLMDVQFFFLFFFCKRRPKLNQMDSIRLITNYILCLLFTINPFAADGQPFSTTKDASRGQRSSDRERLRRTTKTFLGTNNFKTEFIMIVRKKKTPSKGSWWACAGSPPGSFNLATVLNKNKNKNTRTHCSFRPD